MSGYAHLEKRIAAREIIILDGAIGTQLQSMGAPMAEFAWAALALNSHPFTVRRMHENYIAAGVDIITTNTYASARHNLEPLGLGELTAELNLRAVMLAQDARDKAARDRPVLIAGSVSNFGLKIGQEPSMERWTMARRRSETSEAQAKANLREQAETLAEAGVDFLIAEPTGGNNHRKWVIEACLATGLAVWDGFKCRLDNGVARLGYSSEQSLADGFDEITALGGSVVSVFHSPLDATAAALTAIAEQWRGPICVYPEAERKDYVSAHRDETAETPVTPDEFVAWAQACVARGVQIIGGCCGVEIDYIRPLRDALPSHLP
ncbi:MAG: homocysteine S-methyltransferase family protein [Proteobacteria bacterium]|nr:homocysteine S-methyltransferase family protein [Pseudomonadota bacterium]